MSYAYDTVVIRNLPFDCNRHSLGEEFSNCGSIKFVEMRASGSGVIRFDSRRDAERAVGKKFRFFIYCTIFPILTHCAIGLIYILGMMDKQSVLGRVISVHPSEPIGGKKI